MDNIIVLCQLHPETWPNVPFFTQECVITALKTRYYQLDTKSTLRLTYLSRHFINSTGNYQASGWVRASAPAGAADHQQQLLYLDTWMANLKA